MDEVARVTPPPELVEQAWAAEELLLRSDTRHDVNALNWLLADDFHEIGQSGRHWTRSEVVAALTESEDTDDGMIVIKERQANHLADGAVLLTYWLEFDESTSRRSSIWTRRDGELTLLFHQGTPATG
ncbi:MAG: DUF4440 domain-containing protein [Cryobacterium sp.]|nr:DUF4440 domain-containing protein [Micrococcales bacterium]MBX3079860.1 DUF4440 domain-containing protein [Cryobacterium sp.]